MSGYQYMTGICHAILDHPAIRAMERDGYTEAPVVAHQCSCCEEPIYDGESAYNFPGFGWVCEHCADQAYTIAEA